MKVQTAAFMVMKLSGIVRGEFNGSMDNDRRGNALETGKRIEHVFVLCNSNK